MKGDAGFRRRFWSSHLNIRYGLCLGFGGVCIGLGPLPLVVTTATVLKPGLERVVLLFVHVPDMVGKRQTISAGAAGAEAPASEQAKQRAHDQKKEHDFE